ncbi:MAG: S8 family serine peptidase, partial [Gammaproteobacteria bacterium]|nr:S8 family serine peptidase [Gammaproteobacteria bacterium]
MTHEEHSRRLHPRLRVLRNGDASVNDCRAKIATTVAAVERKLDAKARLIVEGANLALVQQSIHALDLNNSAIAKRRLKKRKKLSTLPPADEAFVNVIVQVLRDRDASDPDAEQKILERLERTIDATLEGVDPQLCGRIVNRRNYLSATVPISLLPELEKDDDIAFVSGSEPLKLDIPLAQSAKNPTRRKVGKSSIHNNGEGVIIGIIDVGGFDFSHSDFLDDDGNSRFLAIWDQGGRFRGPPRRFDYGSEFTKDHLDAALKEAKKPGAYPATELEPQSQRRASSHGTHVASIAAGRKGVCPNADIAAVLIDVPLPEDQRERRRFAFSDTSRIVHAVEYLLDIATAENKPISINVSLGTNGGGHDGSSGVSRWLDDALSTPGRCICAAAGNAGQEAATREDDLGWILGRIHTAGRVEARGLEVDLEWTVIGNGIADMSENELEIWYSPQDQFIVQVQPPGETRWYVVEPREFIENKRLRSGTTLSVYNELYHPNNGANYISVYLSPNLEPGNERGVEAGLWKIRLRGKEIRDGRFHAWIERDDPIEIGRNENERLFRFPSFFSARSNVDSHSISSLACGQQIVGV